MVEQADCSRSTGIGLAAISGSTLAVRVIAGTTPADAIDRTRRSSWRLGPRRGAVRARLVDRKRELPPVEARAENWLILTLALLLLAVAARSAWMAIFRLRREPSVDAVDQRLRRCSGSRWRASVSALGLLIDLVIPWLQSRTRSGDPDNRGDASVRLGVGLGDPSFDERRNPSPRAFSMLVSAA